MQFSILLFCLFLNYRSSHQVVGWKSTLHQGLPHWSPVPPVQKLNARSNAKSLLYNSLAKMSCKAIFEFNVIERNWKENKDKRWKVLKMSMQTFDFIDTLFSLISALYLYKYICIYISHLHPFISLWTLGCSHVLAILNNATVNLLVLVFIPFG